MTKAISIFSVAVLAAGFSTAALAQEQTTTVTRAPSSERPAATIVNEIHVTAVVKAVDYQKRTVDLALPNGQAQTFTVSEAAVNFPQVKVGDTVDAGYVESLAISVLGPAEKPITGEGTAVVLAPVGAKPGGFAVNTQSLTARVTAIDYATRMVTLTGPQGNTRTVKAGPEVKRLSEIKVGDQITVQYTEAVLLDVKEAEPAAKPAAPKM
jgi:hypothetical protein